jgi:diketogulonate reductase-like aldo/keto reductase
MSQCDEIKALPKAEAPRVPEKTIKAGRGVDRSEIALAQKVIDAGGTRRDALDAVRAERNRLGINRRVGYLPHQGDREIARRLKRLAKQQTKAEG